MTRPDLPRVLLPGGAEAIAYCERLLGTPQVRVGPFRIFMCPNYHVLLQRINYPARRRGDGHKLQHYARYLGCATSDIDVPRLRLLPVAEAEALGEARRHQLEVDNFVMLCPESYSARGPGRPFWQRLAQALRARGCDVYVNATRPDTWPREAGHTFELGVAAVCALAGRARRIIALRSGLTELLAQSGVPLDVLYGSLPRPAHSLFLFPHVAAGQLREYDLRELGAERCLQLLLERPLP